MNLEAAKIVGARVQGLQEEIVRHFSLLAAAGPCDHACRGANQRERGCHSVAGGGGANRQSVDPISKQVAERIVDRALPLQTAHARESGRLDLDREVAFAAAVMASMAAMAVAVVDHAKMRRSERFAQALVDFGGDRSG